MKQPEQFKADVRTSEDKSSVLLVLSGPITEDVNFGDVLQRIGELRVAPGSPLVADVSRVSIMNSCGIRDWLLFVEKVVVKHPLRFSRVGDVFLTSASVVCNLLGSAGTPIQSFDLGYYCPKCNHEGTQNVHASAFQEKGAAFAMPKIACPSCHSDMEYDGFVEEFERIYRRSRQS